MSKARPSEAEIQQAIRFALGTDLEVVLWRNSGGKTEEWNPNTGGSRTITYGLAKGSADLVGIVCMPDGIGRFLALEIKTPRGRERPEQVTWITLVNKRGGFGAFVRSPEEALSAVARAKRGERA